MQTTAIIKKDEKTPKRPYHKPALSPLGSIGEITQGGLAGSPENNNGGGQPQHFG